MTLSRDGDFQIPDEWLMTHAACVRCGVIDDRMFKKSSDVYAICQIHENHFPYIDHPTVYVMNGDGTLESMVDQLTQYGNTARWIIDRLAGT